MSLNYPGSETTQREITKGLRSPDRKVRRAALKRLGQEMQIWQVNVERARAESREILQAGLRSY